MRLYTKSGDSGQTGLLGGLRVSKGDLRLEVIGTLDELNAHLGVVRAQLQRELSDRGLRRSITQPLEQIQSDLFSLGAYLAEPELPSSLPLPYQRVGELEAAIDRWDADVPPLINFILPGGPCAAAELHVARAVARRAERNLVRLATELALPLSILQYVNRLSDFLFAGARVVTSHAKAPEITWQTSR